MNSIFAKLILSFALMFGLISCVDVAGPGYGGGYGSGYGSGYGGGSRYYNDGYSSGYRNDYYQNQGSRHYHQDPHYCPPPQKKRDVSHEHCYCTRKSCGCKPGHPKGGCNCDGGAHRH